MTDGGRACPECGWGDAVGRSRFCGRCGTLLPEHVEVVPPPTSGAVASAPVGRRPLVRVVAALVAVVGLGALGRVALAPEPPPAPVGGPEAAPADVVAPSWRRDDLVLARPSADVRAAGARHVLVGDRVVATTSGVTVPRLRALPQLSGNLGPDGQWAVADDGVVTVGTIDGVVTSVPSPARPTPVGAAVAWVGDDPVLPTVDGGLVRVDGEGTVGWTTDRPVQATGPIGTRWLVGRGADGQPVVVDLTDGRVAEAPGTVLALLDDLAVVAGPEVLGLDLTDLSELWRRPPRGGDWTVVDGLLVNLGSRRVRLVDPVTGGTAGEVPGFVPVPTAGGGVVQRDGVLRAATWDGEPSWTVDLDRARTHSLDQVDGARLAVRSGDGTAAVVSILATDDGRVLARLPVPAGPVAPLVAAGGAVGVPRLGSEDRTWLDPTTGEDVAAPPDVVDGPLRIASEFGPVVVEAGATTLTGRFPDGRVAWRVQLELPVAAPPVSTGARLVVATTDGTVRAVDPARGTIQWAVDVDALPTALAPAVDALHVGTADGRVVELDSLGAVVRQRTVGGAVVGLVVAGDVLVVGRPTSVLAIPADR